MSTKIIVEPRRSGKTTKAIMESAKTGSFILVSNFAMARAVYDTARYLGIDIPYPITVEEWKDMGIKTFVRKKGIIIDEGLIVLEALLDARINMITISEREDQEGASID